MDDSTQNVLLLHNVDLLNVNINFIFNFTIYILIFLFIKKIKIIDNNLFLFIVFYTFTSMMISNMSDWWIFPDQQKYLLRFLIFREHFFDFKDYIYGSYYKDATYISIFFSLFPIFFVEGPANVALVNHYILHLTLIFFLNKNVISKYHYILICLIPSVFIHSTFLLKDMTIMSLSLFFLYFLIIQRYLPIVLILGMTYLFREPLSYFYLIIFLFAILLNFLKEKRHIKVFFVTTFFITLVFLFRDQFILLINSFIKTYNDRLLENSVTNINLNLNFKEIFLYETVFQNIIKFLINPVIKVYNLKDFVIFIDTIILYFFIFIILIKNKKFSLNLLITLIFLGFCLILYSTAGDNSGQIIRYRFCFAIPFLIMLHYISKKNFKGKTS